MRVILATEFAPPRRGGIERQVAGLVTALVDAGHDASIVTPQPGPPDPRQRRLDLVRAGPITVDPRASAELRAAFEALRPDVVHAHASNLTPFPWAAAGAARALGIPAVLTLHSLPGRIAWLWRGLEAVGGIGAGFALSAVSRAVADEAAPFARGRQVVVLPNGIDCGPAPQHREGDRFVVAAALRLVRRKRPEVVLQALANARAAAPEVPFALRLAGEGALGSRLDRALHPSDRRMGWLEPAALRDLFAQASVFVHPTLREAFGLAPLEAAAAGLAIVARASPGVGEVFGEAAVLCERDEDLGAALVALARDEARREDLARRARQVAERHDWSVVVPQVLDLYRSI